MRNLLLTCAACLLVISCGNDTADIDIDIAASAPPFEPVANIHDLMEHVLDPAVDVIWDSAGYIITIEGEQDLSPTTDELWHEVINASMVVTESGNLLMLPGRSAGADWDTYATGLIAAGKLAIDAAEEQDADALFDAGGRIYQVCKACHNQYWVEVDDSDG